MRAEVITLGILMPDQQRQAEDDLEILNVLQEQAREDIITLSQHGESVAAEKAEYDALWERASRLAADLVSLEVEGLYAWRQEAAALEEALRSLVARTVARRRGAPEARALEGLAWGVGALAVAGGLAYLVWQRKGRRRVRAR